MGKNTTVAIKHPFDKSQEIVIYPTIGKRDRPQFEGEPVRQCKLAKFFCGKTIKTRPRPLYAASAAKTRATPQPLGNTYMKPLRPRGRGSVIAAFCQLYGGSIPAESLGASSTAKLGPTTQSTGNNYMKSLKTRDSETSSCENVKASSSLKDEPIPVVKPSTHKKSSKIRDSESSASKAAKASSSLKDEPNPVVKPSTHKKSSKTESSASKAAKASSSLKGEPIPIGKENVAKKPRKKMWVRIFEKMWIIPKEDYVTDATVSSSVKQKARADEENKDTKRDTISQKMWIIPKETPKVSPEAPIAGASGKKQKKNLKVGFAEKKETRSLQDFKPALVADASDEDDASGERSLSDVSSSRTSTDDERDNVSSNFSEEDSVTDMNSMSTRDDRGRDGDRKSKNRMKQRDESSVAERNSISTLFVDVRGRYGGRKGKNMMKPRDASPISERNSLDARGIYGDRNWKNMMKQRDESSVLEMNSISTLDDRDRYGDRKFKSRMILRGEIPVPEMNSLDDRGGDGDWKIPRDGSTVLRNEAASTAGRRRRKPVIKRRKIIKRPEIALTYEDTSEIYVSSDDDVLSSSRDIKKIYSFGDNLSQALWDEPPVNGRKIDLQEEGNEKALCAKFGKLMTDFKRDLKEIIEKPRKSGPNERGRRTYGESPVRTSSEMSLPNTSSLHSELASSTPVSKEATVPPSSSSRLSVSWCSPRVNTYALYNLNTSLNTSSNASDLPAPSTPEATVLPISSSRLSLWCSPKVNKDPLYPSHHSPNTIANSKDLPVSPTPVSEDATVLSISSMNTTRYKPRVNQDPLYPARHCLNIISNARDLPASSTPVSEEGTVLPISSSGFRLSCSPRVNKDPLYPARHCLNISSNASDLPVSSTPVSEDATVLSISSMNTTRYTPRVNQDPLYPARH